MAPTFRHGKLTRIVCNNRNLSPVLNDYSITAEIDTADTTCYGSDDKTYIPGLRGGQVSMSGLFDGNGGSLTTGRLNYAIERTLGASTTPVFTVYPEGDTAGRLARLFKADAVSYETMSPANGVVGANMNAQITEQQDYGTCLKSLTAVTSTGAGTTVTAAASTGGGVAHIHVVAASTVTSVTIKVQHSSGGAWTDLATHTSTDIGFTRTELTGTIKAQTRAIVTAFTGGASKSVSYTAAIARRA